jgi:hypothetical protein
MRETRCGHAPVWGRNPSQVATISERLHRLAHRNGG